LSDGTSRVLRLRKALYGLKQAPRAWEQELGRFPVKLGFKRSITDQALYYKFVPGGMILVPIYVDDLAVTGAPPQAIHAFKDELKKVYETRDFGPVSTYLGVQVERNRAKRTLSLGLPKCITALEKKFQGLLGTGGKGDRSPMVPEVSRLLK
ncbi:hypothetical protein EBZ38_14895, partial [bacterium]|nr:hypothetical protein [bacterium]